MLASPLQVKICGVTSTGDFIEAVNAGADAVGLNFYPQSKRYLGPAAQNEIAGLLDQSDESQFRLNRPAASVVGVFVNSTADEIATLAAELRLGGIQLHGDEPPELLPQLPGCTVIRARRLDERGLSAIGEDLLACRQAGRMPDAVLLDAAAAGLYGGSGETLDWESLSQYREYLGEVPLILAGGLTPDNVAEAIRIVRPAAVDVASGVEKSAGVKDPQKMRAFVEAAKSAFAAL